MDTHKSTAENCFDKYIVPDTMLRELNQTNQQEYLKSYVHAEREYDLFVSHIFDETENPLPSPNYEDPPSASAHLC